MGVNEQLSQASPAANIRDLTDEAVQQIMEQAQVFASGWALVGGRFDSGNALEDAEDAKAGLHNMVLALADKLRCLHELNEDLMRALETVEPILTRMYGGADVPPLRAVRSAIAKAKEQE